MNKAKIGLVFTALISLTAVVLKLMNYLMLVNLNQRIFLKIITKFFLRLY